MPDGPCAGSHSLTATEPVCSPTAPCPPCRAAHGARRQHAPGGGEVAERHAPRHLEAPRRARPHLAHDSRRRRANLFILYQLFMIIFCAQTASWPIDCRRSPEATVPELRLPPACKAGRRRQEATVGRCRRDASDPGRGLTVKIRSAAHWTFAGLKNGVHRYARTSYTSSWRGGRCSDVRVPGCRGLLCAGCRLAGHGAVPLGAHRAARLCHRLPPRRLRPAVRGSVPGAGHVAAPG